MKKRIKNIMKRTMGILIIAAFAIGFFAAALTLYLPDIKIKTHAPTEDFEAFLDLRVPKLMEMYGVPGVSIALVRDGQIVCTAAYGDADQMSGRKMAVDLPMRVQSISRLSDGKLAVSLAILAILGWALCQKYLFITAIFPVSSVWLGVSAAAFSLVLLIESLCQKKVYSH